MAKTLLPYPKSTTTKTAQQVMAEYEKKRTAGQYVFEGGKWYETTTAFDPAAYATEKGYTKYYQKDAQWYGNVSGTWQTAESKEKARELAGLTTTTAPAPAPTPITVPTGKAAIGKQVTIGGTLYPSQEWYDVNVAKKTTAAPKPTALDTTGFGDLPKFKPGTTIEQQQNILDLLSSKGHLREWTTEDLKLWRSITGMTSFGNYSSDHPNQFISGQLSDVGTGVVKPTLETIEAGVAGVAEKTAALIKQVETEGITKAGEPPAVPVFPDTIPTPPLTPIDTAVPSGDAGTPVLPPETALDTTTAYFQGLQADLDTSRKALEDMYKQQLDDLKIKQEAAQKKIDDLTAKQEDIIETDVEPLLAPFRAELETAERERLYINENFEANQRLTNELSTLLTQGNALIEQQRAVTGLAVIRDPRIAKTISDLSARAGVIEAVINARNGQIAQAYTMIDRSVAATTADKQDQLNYYNTLLNFYGEQKGTEEATLLTITGDQREFLNAQIGLIENDLANAQANADSLKEAMTDPETSLAYANAGITLQDSPAQIAQKLSQYAYTQEVRATSDEMGRDGYTYLTPEQTAPEGTETITTTDSQGKQKTWFRKVEAETPKLRTQIIEVEGRKKLVNLDTGEIIEDLGIAKIEKPTPLKGTTGANYNTRLNQEITAMYSGRYGREGSREQVIDILQKEFPDVDVAGDIYSRVPDGYETQIKKEKEPKDTESKWEKEGTVWQWLETEEAKALSDEEKASQIKQFGLNPETFGIY